MVISNFGGGMTERHMRILVEVYSTLNMTKAAEHLNMTQPAVTKAIKDIEEHYGIRLFERLNKGLAPTEKCRNVYYKALAVLSTYNSMEKELKDNSITGSLRIGSSISLGIYMIPHLVKDLGQSFPKLDIRVTVENGASIERKLLSNELDIAYIEGQVSHSDLVGIPIMNDRQVVIVSPESDIPSEMDFDEMMGYPMLLREKGSISRAYVEGLCMYHNYNIDPIWESESSYAIINAVHENIGISILPERIVSHLAKVGWVRMVRIRDVDFSRVDHLVIHKDKYRSPIIKSLIDWDYRGRYLDIPSSF